MVWGHGVGGAWGVGSEIFGPSSRPSVAMALTAETILGAFASYDGLVDERLRQAQRRG